ncbi:MULTISPECIES: LysR family transcriptional regulator [unclassified Polaromonas]|uniref:LysR family transcriptional regulator n=1 Tax=unclassified Polaromonas TaxID=2638319 RepID=UPI000BCA6CAB|nr:MULTISPECIES: LysR family transcriptional regulator [unclassified Polaromonas]OYY32258.1 MAG: LysR family transcriptional regulator [Polaromonas sp. 35-63-35]OYZ20944.1 MAG: LysR family transcriptional regulator [Polaromonas sp. 16-63-31]OYZ78591.1 MAG: LysR family transcriptional regulator [Polaromonas sp. 24-63-21]OZA49234.1 MAG: LysR family transcriptional regulator [Polaromonas sp. 17-63-33]OZA85961.1 MAG: LysR family transcriptional regulator [Polaromonas sp. 39-63-25]
MTLPLNALRAFEVSARHLSFTRAGLELNVTQAAVSAQVKNLEARLGVPLFRRLPRGLALTDEGHALLPMLSDSFGRLGNILEQFRGGAYREPVTVAAVSTFAVGWLLPRLETFHRDFPFIDLRLMTHNNRVDLAGEGLDFAIRFGQGAWHGTHADPLFEAPLTPMCTPAIARRLSGPRDMLGETLLRSYRSDEWKLWFEAAGAGTIPQPLRGPVLDSSLALAAAAAQGAGIALLPRSMFLHDLQVNRLVQPFAFQVRVGSYWLTQLQSKSVSPAMAQFREWLLREAAAVAQLT